MPLEPAPRQTLSFLMRRFEEAGIRPQTAFGQNFLIDLNLLHILFESAAVGADDVVLEVGTGTGSLTALLAQRAAAVVTVEVDPRMFQLAAEELHRFDNVVMLQVDALKSKNWMNPAVLDAIRLQLNAAAGRQFKLVPTLLYTIATQILGTLLAEERPPRTMTATIQKELAERITARPGDKDYGALSLWVQTQARVEILRTLPPEVFWPRPKVSSAFIQITVDDELRGRIPDRRFYHDFLRGIFLHRRKFLRSQLLAAAKNVLDKPQVDALLAEVGFSGSLRAEQLDVEQMLALCEAVRRHTTPLTGEEP
jgi:16S rRNA (adenine1518-N6/adenine1519-N6)-dimethyltransferase